MVQTDSLSRMPAICCCSATTIRTCVYWPTMQCQQVSPFSCDPWLFGWLPPSVGTTSRCLCNPWPSRSTWCPWWSPCRWAHCPPCRTTSSHSFSRFASQWASCGPRWLDFVRHRWRQCSQAIHHRGRRGRQWWHWQFRYRWRIRTCPCPDQSGDAVCWSPWCAHWNIVSSGRPTSPSNLSTMSCVAPRGDYGTWTRRTASWNIWCCYVVCVFAPQRRLRPHFGPSTSRTSTRP